MELKFNIAGQRFGRLLAEVHVGSGRWRCRCDCGNESVVNQYQLRKGATRSCGCLKAELDHHRNAKHGLSGTKTYEIWKSMRARCNRPTNKSYKNYGGRGISVCARWDSHESFLADMGECPAWYSIERKDVNGNYEPGNCEWIPLADQAKNKRPTNRIKPLIPEIVKLRKQGLSQDRIAEITGVNQGTISRILAREGFEKRASPKKDSSQAGSFA